MAQSGDGGRGRGRGGDGSRDRGRDGGRSGGGGAGGGGAGSGGGQSSRSQKSYRAQLDRLFESGKIGELVASTEKARAFASASGAPAGTPPQVTVSTGKVLRNQPSGGTAADDRQRESRAGLGAELARAIARAESGASAQASTPATPTTPISPDEATPTPTPSISARRAALPLPAAASDAVTAGDAETRLKLIAKLRDAEGRDAITRATEALAARFPIPDDFELLTRLLEHRDDTRVTYALERLGVMLRKEQPRRGRAMAAQLRFLEETSDEAEVRSKAAEVRALVK